MNEVLKVLKERRSCRSYRPEQITDEELNAVLEAGTYAPTARGQQSPIIVAVQNPAVVEQLRKMNAAVLGTPEADPFYGAPTVLVVLALVFLAPVLAVRLSDREKNDNSIPSKETVPRIFWKRVSNMRQSSCGHRTETVSAAAGESRMSCRPGSGRMCGTLMRTQRFLHSMIQKITTR